MKIGLLYLLWDFFEYSESVLSWKPDMVTPLMLENVHGIGHLPGTTNEMFHLTGDSNLGSRVNYASTEIHR